LELDWQVFGRGTWVGLAATFFAGFCFALFSPLFNLASNDQFHLLKRGVRHLVVYTGFFYFSVSFTVMAVILNVSFLYHPILGAPKSSVSVYLRDWNGRGWAILAGLLCGFGNGLRFMGGQAAGYATADSVQVRLSLNIFPLVKPSVTCTSYMRLQLHAPLGYALVMLIDVFI